MNTAIATQNDVLLSAQGALWYKLRRLESRLNGHLAHWGEKEQR